MLVEIDRLYALSYIYIKSKITKFSLTIKK